MSEIPSSWSDAFDPDVTVCYDSSTNSWRVRAVSITSFYHEQVCLQGRIAISSANDPDLTSGNYCDVLDDFTPGSDGYAPYSTYIADTCVWMHEDTHVAEWQQVLDNLWAARESSGLETLSTSFVCDTVDTSQEALDLLENDVNSFLDRLYNDALADWGPEQQSQALNNENSCLQALRDAIMQRAANEQWPSCSP